MGAWPSTTTKAPPMSEDLIPVPAGARPSRCRGENCGRTIYYVERPKMRKGQPVPGQTARIPVDCDVPGGSSPDSLSEGRGVNHFTNCVDARGF